jgi:hypothetical protein
MRITLYAQRCADRVAVGDMRFDPVTILTIFTTVLPLLMNCLKSNVAEPTQAEMSAYIKREADKNRKRLNNRIASRIRGKAEEPMSKDEARKLADAVIEEGLADTSTEADISQFVVACASVVAADD